MAAVGNDWNLAAFATSSKSRLFAAWFVFTCYFQFQRVGDESAHRVPSFVSLARSLSSMRSAGRALTGLVDGVGGIGLHRCACSLRTFLYSFLCFLLSFRLYSSGCAFMPLASSCSIANDWPSQLVRTRVIISARSCFGDSHVLESLGDFLACTRRSYPHFLGIRGVEAARRVV